MERTVTAGVGAEIVLYDADASLIAKLRRTLRYPNPEYVKAARFGDVDDDIDPHICAVDERPDGSVRIPRGAIFELKLALRSRRLTLVIRDDTRVMKEPLSLSSTLQPRDYQAEGISEVKRNLQGMIVLPCGGGKTACGVGSIVAIQQPTLVVAPTVDLVDQWAEEVENRLGVKPAIFGSGKHQQGAITIATKDALLYHVKHHSDKALDLEQFGFVIFDECHNVAARTPQLLLRHIPARYRLGLTATPKREDGGTPLVRWSFGDLLMERSVPELVDGGWLVLPTVEAVYTDFDYEMPDEPHMSEYNRLNAAIERSAARNAKIVRLVAQEPEESWLVLTNRKAHCAAIEEQLTGRGISALAVTSKLAKGKRKKALADFRSGALKVVVATSLADQGLDVKRMSRCILALPERAKGRTQQRVGRLMRPFGQKRAKLYDFVDHNVEVLRNRWSTRKSVYRSLGLEISECPTLSLFNTATA